MMETPFLPFTKDYCNLRFLQFHSMVGGGDVKNISFWGPPQKVLDLDIIKKAKKNFYCRTSPPYNLLPSVFRGRYHDIRHIHRIVDF